MLLSYHDDQFNSVVIDSHNKIVCAGQSNSYDKAFLVRYNPNGRLDSLANYDLNVHLGTNPGKRFGFLGFERVL